MAVVMQNSRSEQVDSFEIRIGNESIKVHFGRKVSITKAVELARSWLSGLDGEHP